MGSYTRYLELPVRGCCSTLQIRASRLPHNLSGWIGPDPPRVCACPRRLPARAPGKKCCLRRTSWLPAHSVGIAGETCCC
jgi:hypothetical protein